MGSASGDDETAPGGPAAGAEMLCFAHIHDTLLAEQLWDDSSSGLCGFCPADAGSTRVIPLSHLADTVWEAVAEVHPGDATDSAVEWVHGDLHKVPPDPAQTVAEECRGALAPEVMKAVAEYIDGRVWYGNPRSFVPRSTRMRDNWTNFCRTVTERDLELPDGDTSPGSDRDKLRALMGRIAEIIDEVGLITVCRPGERIWRGRMRLDRTPPGYAAADIGCAPPERAAENRMSRAGVPMFYGSADIDTAVAEISARDARPFAAVAAFEVTRQIRVVDLADIREPPSLFDREQASLRDSIVFLKDLAEDLSRAVIYDGRKHRDYRPTQYVTDYLRESPGLRVEGIRFRSAHNEGVNYALFLDAAACRSTLRLLEGTECVVPRSHLVRQGPATQAVQTLPATARQWPETGNVRRPEGCSAF